MSNKELEAELVDKAKHLLDTRNYWFAAELIKALQAFSDYKGIE